MVSEFDLIARYFSPLTMGREVACGLSNDTASIIVPDGMELVVSSDMLLEGRHFFAGTSPEIIAQKMLRSNISDIVSSGARMHSYQMSLALPEALARDEVWLSAFTAALLADQQRGGFYCSGGDTTRAMDGLVLNVTAFGLAPKGRSILRSDARAGDALIVGGAIGAGYVAFQEGRSIAPPWRADIADIVQRHAHGALDVSDGLLADVAHIARASGLSAVIKCADVPIIGDDRMGALQGGDDYEIALACSPDDVEACLSALRHAGCAPACIGRFADKAGEPLLLLDQDGRLIDSPKTLGWQHF